MPNPYDEETMEQWSQNNSHIPDEVLKQDIADTEEEIADYERKAEGYKLIGDKMSLFKADAYISEIQDRKDFIFKLQSILDYRRK